MSPLLSLLALAPAMGYNGRHLLRDPIRNRGTAFSPLDREANALVGLLPAAVESVEKQLARAKMQFDQMPTPISKYLWLRELEEDSTTLFYEFVANNLIECLPCLYTPTVGEVCVRFSELWRRPKGVFITASDKGRMRQILDNVPMTNVHIIVVTDGGRILGLGDLGANGMGIPIGKIGLYVAGGGFDPAHALPVSLDFGTNNEKLLADPLYIGARHRRLPEEQYYELVDEFLSAVKHKWPKCLVQFEDFATHHSLPLLDKYRSKMLCFNDDIQGTGSVILGGLLNALKIQGTEPKDAKIVFYGAGSAAVGCAQMIISMLQSLGVSEEDAYKQFWMMDSKGLLTSDRPDMDEIRRCAPHKLPFVRSDMKTCEADQLISVIAAVQPNVLMGLSGSGEAFGKHEIENMHKTCVRPIICPLSNPTSKAEISAEKAYTWTNGECIFASGSPFAPVTINGETYTPAQGNNMFIFPGVGLGAFLCSASEVTDEMFIEAAKCLSAMVEPARLKAGALYPPLEDLLDISAQIAANTIETAIRGGQSGMQFNSHEEVLAFVRASMWSPPRHVDATSSLPVAATFRMSATAGVDEQVQPASIAPSSDDADDLCTLDAPQHCLS